MLKEIITNQIFIACALAWVIAQGIKMALYYRKHHRLNFRLLVGTGGMPSSHTAFVIAMSTMVGLKEGWSSTYFMIALCFSFVTMSDAAGVRRAVGRQAAMLNMVVDDFYAGKAIPQARLIELLGHTPLEVFAGAFLGIAVAVSMYFLPRLM